MKINKGILALSVASGVFLAGSAKKSSVNISSKVAPKNLNLDLKPQPLVDTLKIQTFDCTDDGPVLPRFRLK